MLTAVIDVGGPDARLSDEVASTPAISVAQDDAPSTFAAKLPAKDSNYAEAPLFAGDEVTATVNANSATPTISISPGPPAVVGHLEGDGGTTDFVFDVTLSSDPDPGSPVTVWVDTADGTATLTDNDYQQYHQQLTFSSGDPLTQQVTVHAVGDRNLEPDEDFTVNLSDIVGADPGNLSATGWIYGDDIQIDAGTWWLQDNLAGQEITLTIASGGVGVQAIDLNVQIADGYPDVPGSNLNGPDITGLDLTGPDPAPDTVFGSVDNSGTLILASVPQLWIAGANVDLSVGTVPADGVLAHLTLSTAGTYEGNGPWPINLLDTYNGDTALQTPHGEIIPTVVNGWLYPDHAPVADPGGPYSVPEGGSVPLDGSSSHDPDAGDGDSITAYVWDLDGDGNFGETGSDALRGDELGPTPTFSAAGLDDGLRTISLRVYDTAGLASSVATTQLSVTNAAPVITSVTVDSQVDENGTVTLSGSFTDPGTADTHTVQVDWGDGTAATPAAVTEEAGSGTFTATHQYLDDNPSGTPFDVKGLTVTVTDDDGGIVEDTSRSVQVNNVAPVITSVTADVQADGSGTVELSGSFTDVGTLDTHTAMIDWGDGTAATPATVTEEAGSGTFTATHQYVDEGASGMSFGVKDVTVTVSDDDGGSAEAVTTIFSESLAMTVGSGTVGQGNAVRLPVRLTQSAAGLQAALLVMHYDTAALDVTSDDIALGGLVSGLEGDQAWTLTPDVDDAAGTITVQLESATPLAGGTGDLLEIVYHAAADAPLGDTPLDLDQGASHLNDRQLGVTATDGVLTVTVPGPAWQNPNHPLDVNPDYYISAQDALLLANFLYYHGQQPVPEGPGTPPFPAAPPPYYDVSGDGWVTAQDVLLVANFLYYNGQQPIPHGQENAPSPAQPSPSYGAGVDAPITTRDTSASAAAPTSQPTAPAPAKALPADSGSLAVFGQDKATASIVDWGVPELKGPARADAPIVAKAYSNSRVVEEALAAGRLALAASIVDRVMASTRWNDALDFADPGGLDNALPASPGGSGLQMPDGFFVRPDKFNR